MARDAAFPTDIGTGFGLERMLDTVRSGLLQRDCRGGERPVLQIGTAQEPGGLGISGPELRTVCNWARAGFGRRRRRRLRARSLRKSEGADVATRSLPFSASRIRRLAEGVMLIRSSVFRRLTRSGSCIGSVAGRSVVHGGEMKTYFPHISR